MDLIYTNSEHREIGVLNPIYYDEFFGVNQDNSFELQLAEQHPLLDNGALVYCDNSEIGGIIDSVYASNLADTVTYRGRTWHGILNSKVFVPDVNEDHITFYGDAHEVLREAIYLLELSDIFTVPEYPADIDIVAFEMPRFEKGYDGILKMLLSADAKLIVKRDGKYTQLSAEPTIDYSQFEEFTSQVEDIGVRYNYHPVNHLICMGQGELQERAVIHLFLDENGGLMPYAQTASPLQDSDYILNKSQQVLFGLDEVADVYDYSSAEITNNYIPLSEQPDDWAETFGEYFKYEESDEDEEDKFVNIKEEFEKVYTLLSSAPSDWAAHYTNYYIKKGSKYRSVESSRTENYKLLKKKPKKWNKLYSSYYEYYSDGVSSDYRMASGVYKHKYKKQTQKPTDWDNRFSSYYMKNKKGRYISVKATGAPPFEKNKYYKKIKNRRYELLTKKPFDWSKNWSAYYYKKNTTYYAVEGNGAPKWKKGKYYTDISYTVAPKWKKGRYYERKQNTSAPAFERNKYYQVQSQKIVPDFIPGEVYREVHDRYAVLVDNGIDYLKELLSQEEVNIVLDENGTYNVGDVIGAEVTKLGLMVSKPIIKINITLDEFGEFVQTQEVGELNL